MYRKLAFVCGVLLLLSSPIVSADAISDIQAQIQALVAQLTALQQNAPSTTPPGDDYPTLMTGARCPDLTRTLQRGSRDATTGGQVSELQLFLADHFGLNDEDMVTGYFGLTTERAVTRFQTEQSLPAYGIVGSLTRARIAAVCAGAPTGIPTSPAVPRPFIYLQADPTDIVQGQTATVRWRVTDATRCWLQYGPVQGTHKEESVGFSGERQFSPTADYTVILGCANEVTPPKDGPANRASVTIRVVPPRDAQGITVTTPNGGEQWEMGTTNTVTWRPYSYNPDVNPSRDVTAYLERYIGEKENGEKVFEVIGKVQESGKASIHWIAGELNSATCSGQNPCVTYATPGAQYYVRVVNNTTGKWDRSDAPFTLLAKPIDLKLNGVDGPIVAGLGTPVAASWTARAGMTNCSLNNASETPAGERVYTNIPVSSQGRLQVYVPTNDPWAIVLQCQRPDGTTVWDSVSINLTTPPKTPSSITVVSPNGGERIDPTINQWNIKTVVSGLKTFSMALYKNNQWYSWLFKDVSTAGRPQTNFEWVHSHTAPQSIPGISATGDNGGSIWKIYVTGQKSDGSGYADDMSDAPFAFVGAPTPSGPAAVTSWKKYAFKTFNNKRYCTGGQYVGYSAKYDKWVGAESCDDTKNTEYKLYMSATETGTYYEIEDNSGNGQDQCELVNPNFTITNDDEVTSGSCKNCAIQTGYETRQGLTVFSRSRVGEAFQFGQCGVWWCDIYPRTYSCGVPIAAPVVATAAPACTVTASKSSYSLGESVVVNWSSSNASYMSFDPQTSIGLVVPGDKLDVRGTQTIGTSASGSYAVVMRATALDGRTSSCTATFSVASAAPNSTSCVANGQTYAHGSGYTGSSCPIWETCPSMQYLCVNGQWSESVVQPVYQESGASIPATNQYASVIVALDALAESLRGFLNR